MITRIVKLSFDKKRCDDFIRVFKRHQIAMQSFKDCLSLRAYQHEKGVYFTISEWTSEDGLEMYRNSDYFREIWTTIKPWFSERAVAWSMDEI